MFAHPARAAAVLAAVFTLTTAPLPAEATPAQSVTAGGHHSSGTVPPAAPRSVPAQQNVPELDVPGDAQAVTYPPDFLTRPAASTFTFTAPPHTRIKVLEMDCRPQACAQSIAADGSTATVRTPPGRWRWGTPIRVWLQGDLNAPMPRATYTGSLTLDGRQQPLNVIITEGRQGLLGAAHQTAPGGGARVIAVNPEGAADQAGIREGDIITAFNGRTITTSDDLRTARIGLLRSGATVPLTYKQPNGTIRNTTVTLR